MIEGIKRVTPSEDLSAAVPITSKTIATKRRSQCISKYIDRNYLVFRGGSPVCCVSSLPGAAFTRPCVTGDVLAAADVLFLRRLLVYPSVFKG